MYYKINILQNIFIYLDVPYFFYKYNKNLQIIPLFIKICDQLLKKF